MGKDGPPEKGEIEQDSYGHRGGAGIGMGG